MKAFRPRPPSPALVVAIVALVVALGGTAYASLSLPKNSVGSKQLKKNAVTTSKLKNGAVTARKINPKGLTVPNANTANTAKTANTANTANSATTAGSAEAIAYAHVQSDGTLDASHSKNVSSSTLTGSQGIYCLKVTVPVSTGSVTLDSSTGDVGYGSAILSGEDPGNILGFYCPSGMNVLVVMEDQSNSNTDEAFWMSFN